MDQSFIDANVSDIVKKLKVDERVALLGAPNWWNTTAIPRLSIPSVRMSDGPNGVRGSSHFVSTPAQCLPCATSLAATFDAELIHAVGQFLAKEAKIKSSTVLLAPTCNIQRSPLGGRAFESFSEDPHLSGIMAAAYVNGLQTEGVAATIKHFVANDQEHERTAADSVVSERSLREIYLYPFMLAQKLSQPWAYMTSYGRIDNVHCSENPRLLQSILRDEWTFDGLVMSDWYGTYGVSEALNAGLDLEMPGPPRWRAPALVAHSLSAGKLSIPTVTERAETILRFVQKLAKRNPDVVYGDGEERTRDSPEIRNFCRKLAAEGMVLLKNQHDVLPLKPNKDGSLKIAVIGPNAKGYVISGGGSAALKASYVATPYNGIDEARPNGVELSYHVGCYAHKFLPTLENSLQTPGGESGWQCTFHNHKPGTLEALPDVIATFVLKDTRVKLNDFLPPGLGPTWSIKLIGKLTVPTTGPFELGLAVAGRAKLYVDGELVIDNWTKQRAGDFFYGQGTAEEKGLVQLTADKPAAIYVEYTNTPSPNRYDEGPEKAESQPALMRGVRLGGCEKIDPETAIQEAVDIASRSNVVVFVGGLTPEWESEGFDRPTLSLPGLQDELINRIGKANRNTVVCIQAGSAVAMPWVNDVAAIVQAWYSGNEAGNALADVLFGTVNPSGRLPLTLPIKIEDTPSYGSMRSENGKIHYREDLFVGYKHYQARQVAPLFPFGFGLSYTTFKLSNITLSEIQSHDNSFKLTVTVKVTNIGPVRGSQVVQLYIGYPDTGITHPSLQLRGFAKVHDMDPGAETTATIELDKYAVSYWDTPKARWNADAGNYEVQVGDSSDNLQLTTVFELKAGFFWSGL